MHKKQKKPHKFLENASWKYKAILEKLAASLWRRKQTRLRLYANMMTEAGFHFSQRWYSTSRFSFIFLLHGIMFNILIYVAFKIKTFNHMWSVILYYWRQIKDIVRHQPRNSELGPREEAKGQYLCITWRQSINCELSWAGNDQIIAVCHLLFLFNAFWHILDRKHNRWSPISFTSVIFFFCCNLLEFCFV